MPSRKPKKVTKGQQKKLARTAARKALSAWSLAVRERDGHACIVCCKTEHLNAHHLIPKERFPAFKLDVDNGVTLCPSCHKFAAFSFHRHPLWSCLWLQQNRPDLYAAALKRIDSH